MSSSSILPRGGACTTCRAKKQRCDGEKPSCRMCIAGQRECVYEERKKSRAELLHDKIAQLEEKIVQLGGPKTSTSSTSHPSPRSVSSTSQPRPQRSDGSRSSPAAETQRFPGTTMPLFRVNSSFTSPMTPASVTIPDQLRGHLITVFLQSREKCFFEVHVARFMEVLYLPPENQFSPHPCLVNAMMLMGCYFSRAPSLVNQESHLLVQAVQELSTSYNQADRLHDFIRASNLIAVYYLCKGKYVEANQQIVTSVHVTVACGLHQITSSVWRPPSPVGQTERFLPPARDAVDLGERILTLWQTFNIDKMITMATMEPAHFPGIASTDPSKPAIVTPWPRLIQDYENNTVSDMEKRSVQDLFYNLATPIYGAQSATLTGLQAQGLALTQRAFFLSKQDGFSASSELLALDASTQQFIDQLPGGSHTVLSSEMLGSPGHQQLAFIRTLAYTASLLTHKHVTNDVSRYRCAIAAENLTFFISQLSEAEYDRLFIGIGHVWTVAGHVLAALAGFTSGAEQQQYLAWAQVILAALRNLSMAYLPLGLQYKHLHDIIYGTP